VTINAGGHIAPGTSVGALTVASLTLSANSILDYELAPPPQCQRPDDRCPAQGALCSPRHRERHSDGGIRAG
jgi:hypothetical protein